MTKILYATLAAAIILVSVTATDAFAQTNFNKIEGNQLNNPTALDLLKKIENAKKDYELQKQTNEQRKQHQKFIDEQRRLVQASLNQELVRIEKKYEEFTPRNAFEKYISGINSRYHGIFWDQFDYLQTKTSLAKAARDSVLENGGSYVDAMKQYTKYATITKTEMINIMQSLNVKHSFAQDTIQSHFDAKGKLPRYEDDLEAPCYGCTDNISKVKPDSEKTVPVNPASFEPKPDKVDQLRDQLSKLQNKFLESTDIAAQKLVVSDMNKVVKQIHEIE